MMGSTKNFEDKTMIKIKPFSLIILFTVASTLSLTCLADPAGVDQIRLETGTPKRTNETVFYSVVSWRKENENVNKAIGLTFIKGTGTKKPATDVEAARKIANALNAGVNYEAPHSRGAMAEFNKGKAEVLISNREGFDLNRVTFSDYTNQALNISLPNNSFSEASIGVAIDIVYSAAVEYVDNFASGITLEAAGGSVTVTTDNNTPIKIETKGKTTKQIEKEIVQALGTQAHFSATPIFPNFVELKSRNYKTFDGGEVQIPRLNAKSIAIDINDAGLGVLAKFNFPDVNKVERDSGVVFYLIILLVLGALAYFFYTRRKI